MSVDGKDRVVDARFTGNLVVIVTVTVEVLLLLVVFLDIFSLFTSDTLFTFYLPCLAFLLPP